MRGGLRDALISGGALVILAITLMSVDARVRDQVVSTARTTSVSEAGHRVGDLGSTLLLAARDQTVEHAPLAIFVVAGAILFLFMVRT